ncbi:MAG: hypothetical protein PHS04_15935 [Tissierellia bacterium]|jgi:hypothetical protein|nr:hypothetical protein [Candidatus Cloacimonadota bacterium]MDD4439506.1 hypothetical protein [Tissierellia bacterium]HPL94981.1 hypothetical protein [Paludibacteraceae bacterium]
MKKVIVTGVLLTLISFNVFAGPFGIEMGMSLQEVTNLCKSGPKLIGQDLYSIVPLKTNDLFDSYRVRIDPNYGLYMIAAMIPIKTTEDGAKIKSAFNDLVSNIEQVYGNYEKIDILEPGSKHNKPKDFMTSLAEHERTLMVTWQSPLSTLPTNLKIITVTAEAITSSLGWVDLEYRSDNYDKVEAAKKAKKEEQASVF